MQILSGLPATASPLAPLRDAVVLPAAPAASRAVAPTQLASAVLQAPRSDAPAATAPQRLAPPPPKTRLTGPPPAFEMNLLEHLRENALDAHGNAEGAGDPQWSDPDRPAETAASDEGGAWPAHWPVIAEARSEFHTLDRAI